MNTGAWMRANLTTQGYRLSDGERRGLWLGLRFPTAVCLALVVTGLAASQEQGEGVRLAAAVVLMVPSILIYLGLQRLFERGLLSGSLKG